MDKLAKAKKILLKSGWVSKYHFIIDVINGNKNMTIIRPEMLTIIWGRKVLKQYLDSLKMKHPNLSKEFDKLEHSYYLEMRELHESIVDQIFERIKENDGKTENPDEK